MRDTAPVCQQRARTMPVDQSEWADGRPPAGMIQKLHYDSGFLNFFLMF